MTQYKKSNQKSQSFDFKEKITIQLPHENYVTNYYGLMRSHNLTALLKTVQEADTRILSMPVYLFVVSMVPQNVQWLMWKGTQEITLFLNEIKEQIQELKQNVYLSGQYQKKIQLILSQLQSNILDATNIKLFAQLLNLLADNHYLKKNQQFLTFINHCVPEDKWQMKIYRQFYIYEKSSSLFELFSPKDKKERREFFITITGHGILKSDRNLQQSRITMMIPFTNQLTILSQTSTNQISFSLQSCEHQKIQLNFQNDEYIEAINFMVALTMALDQSQYLVRSNRYKSFAPQRINCAGKLYVDGAQYFQDLYDQLVTAKWQVCITGWKISPYFLLKRPNNIDSIQYRLDGILKTLAQRGVKIFIIVYKQFKVAVVNDSNHVQNYLQSLHDNIRVYRHSTQVDDVMWSHHQKMVIIDQQIGFMGGLDLSFSRWDNCRHELSWEVDPKSQLPYWDGIDYSNHRITEIKQLRNYKVCSINKNFQPRMPWHDIALQFRGDIVLDLLRHFVQYWYFVKAQLDFDAYKGITKFKKRVSKVLQKNDTSPQYKNNFLQGREKSVSQELQYIFTGGQKKFFQLLIQKNPGRKVGSLNMQMCRCASEWSIGIRSDQCQKSIHNAYLDLIENAQNFIYIQNQYFMGKSHKVIQKLGDKIIQRHKKRRPFRVIVVMPLVNDSAGDLGNKNNFSARYLLHYQYLAIIRSPDSLFARLQAAGIGFQEASRYIYFFGLRQSGIINGVPMTQIIYVHSKLMIVDDTRCIIGSANINDRSLLGDRDSQIICVIQEPTQSTGCIFGLRQRIFAQHFGLNKQRLNILDDDVWNSIIANAQRATLFYRKTFGCIPDDLVTRSWQIQAHQNKANIKYYQQKQNQVIAHAVQFPLNFMKNQQLDLTDTPGATDFFQKLYS